MKKCDICGTAMSDDVMFCPICGAIVKSESQTPSGIKPCPACGTSVSADNRFCPQCGAELPVDQISEAEESSTAEQNAEVEDSSVVESISADSEESATVEDTAADEENSVEQTGSVPPEAAADMVCATCGASVAVGKKFCPQCGAEMRSEHTDASEEISAQEQADASSEAASDMICATCGASVAAGKKFCPQCGTDMRDVKNADRSKTNGAAHETATDKTCTVCGTAVAAGKKFCPQCGAEVRDENVADKTQANTAAHETATDRMCTVCGAAVAAGKKFCPQCGAEVRNETRSTAQNAFCPQCGAKAEEGKKFCTQCGAALNVSRTGGNSQITKATYKPTGEAATTVGKVKQILPTIGTSLTLLLTIIFMFVPFLSVRMSMLGIKDEVVHHGVPGLGVLFTGNSALIAEGANEIVMRLVGAGYIALILALIWYILFAVSNVFRYGEKSLNRQVGLNAALTAISLVLMILCIITRMQISAEIDRLLGQVSSGIGIAATIKTSWFMGAVGLFAVNVIMLVYAVVMRALYRPALDRPALTPDLLGKKVCGVLIGIDVLVVLVCIIVPTVMGCAGSANPKNAPEISDRGSFSIKCDDTITERGVTLYCGVEYFVYTPVSDGTISVDIVGSGGGAVSMAMVGIQEYDEVYSLWKDEGDIGVIIALEGYDQDSYRVTAGTKYCIVFGAASLTKNDKISVNYYFDDGGTRTVKPVTPENDTIDKAYTITANTIVSTGEPNAKNCKWYKFTPVASGIYVIETTRYSGDPDIYIYDSTTMENVVAYDRDIGGFRLETPLIVGQEYYIEIKVYNESSCSFTVTRYTHQGGGGSSRADAIAMTLDTTYETGDIAGDGSKWYKYTALSRGTYTLSSTDYAGDPDLYVYDSVSSSVTLYEDSSEGGFTKSFVMDYGDTYYFCIKSYHYTAACSFKITKESTPSRENAVWVVLGGAHSVDISTNGERWYKYAPDVNGTYNIKTLSYSGDPDIEIYDSLYGSYPIESDGSTGGFDINVTMTVGKTYYFKMYNPGSCTFQITYKYDERYNAIEADLGIEHTTDYIYSGSVRWYKYTPYNSGIYNIYVTQNQAATSFDVEVYDSLTASVPCGTRLPTEVGVEISCEMTADRTYYIKIIGGAFSTSYCKFKISEGTGTSKSKAIQIFESAEVATGALQSGRSIWYKFAPGANGTYNIMSTSVQGDPDVSIYASVAAASPVYDDNAPGGFSLLNKTLSANNTYYIKIFAANAASCTFKIEKVSADQGGSDRENATSISTGTTYDTGRSLVNYHKWYKLRSDFACVALIKTTTHSGDPNVRIYKDSEQDPLAENTEIGGFGELVRFEYGSTYYIDVYGDSSSRCEFRVQMLDAHGGDSISSAFEIGMGRDNYTGYISPDAGLWYKFTPMISANYDIACNYYTGDPDVSVYDPQSYNIATSTDSGGFAVSVALEAGKTYYIHIYADVSSTGVFSVKRSVE